MDNSSRSVLSVGFLFMAVYLQDTVSNISPVWIAAGVLLRAQSDRFAQQAPKGDATDPHYGALGQHFPGRSTPGRTATGGGLDEKEAHRERHTYTLRFHEHLPSFYGRLTALDLQC